MAKVYISKEIEFDAAHRVPNHKSKCFNLHGHRYKVRATVQGPVVNVKSDPEYGMVVDFGFLKEVLAINVHDLLDHGCVIDEDDMELHDFLYRMHWKLVVLQGAPTAENLARWIWEQIVVPIAQHKVTLVDVTVWETPTSTASYQGVVYGGV